jgi:hypothetical protein
MEVALQKLSKFILRWTLDVRSLFGGWFHKVQKILFLPHPRISISGKRTTLRCHLPYCESCPTHTKKIL